jgi:hypothetical protein
MEARNADAGWLSNTHFAASNCSSALPLLVDSALAKAKHHNWANPSTDGIHKNITCKYYHWGQ